MKYFAMDGGILQKINLLGILICNTKIVTRNVSRVTKIRCACVIFNDIL